MFVWEYSYMYIFNLYNTSDYRNYAATQSKAWGNTTFVEVKNPLSPCMQFQSFVLSLLMYYLPILYTSLFARSKKDIRDVVKRALRPDNIEKQYKGLSHKCFVIVNRYSLEKYKGWYHL